MLRIPSRRIRRDHIRMIRPIQLPAWCVAEVFLMVVKAAERRIAAEVMRLIGSSISGTAFA